MPAVPKTPSKPKGSKSKKTKKQIFASNKSKGSKSKGINNVTKLTTYSNKSEKLSIQFREQFDFRGMGGKAGSSPCLIRVDMNNPFKGLSNPDPHNDDVIMQVVGGLKTGCIEPTFTRDSYDGKYNLTDRLESYAREYRSCIVTKSKVTFNVRPKLNQVWHNSDNVSVVPYFINQVVNSGADPYVLKWSVKPSATGDLYVWSVRQQDHSQLHDLTNGVLPLSTLKAGVPNIRMNKMNVTPTSVRGTKFTLNYTPRSQFQIKDILDNKQLLNCLDGTQATPLTINADQKTSYAYLGIGAKINGYDPDPTEGGSSLGMANCVVEAVIDYELLFTERFNTDGNNEPTPLHTDL